MKKIHTETLIIGAGPACLACAMELTRAKKEFIVVERDAQVGGLAKTYTFTEGDLVFRTDNGPHRFFSKNQYLYDFIGGIIKEHWITVNRQTRQYIDGKFYDYPINIIQAVKNVGFYKAFRMGRDYFLAKVKYAYLKKPIKNFSDYVYANFGKTLGEFNMINYTEKIWGIPSETIHSDWAGQRIKGLSIGSLLKDFFGRIFGIHSASKPKTLVDMFYYPDIGTGFIYETIADRIKESGRTILFNSYPEKVFHGGSKCRSAIINTPEGQVEIEFDFLVESVPLTDFVLLMDPALSPKVLEANKKLHHRSQVYLFITLDKDSITNDQWIYFPNKDIPFARISEMKNFSGKMSPPGKTSLFVEFFCFENDEVWNMNKEELLRLSLPYFEKMKFFSADQVRNCYLLRKKNAYPIYDINYKTFLDEIKETLDSFPNLFYIGRPGRFRYNNQDHSLEMGLLAAKSIIEGVRYDIESIGNEQEYYEKGALKDKTD